MLRFYSVAGVFILVAAGGLTLADGGWAASCRLTEFYPQGQVHQVRQAKAVFSSPMVAFGDPQGGGDPFSVQCSQGGRGRWVDPRTWV